MTIEREKGVRIFLTGFMGSGKSTIGPILANSIGYDFVDIDRSIEKQIGRTINEIFREDGEARFRLLEKRLLLDLQHTNMTVVALGGGTIAELENFNAIRGSGILVYLRMTPEQLFARLRLKKNRPLLVDQSGERIDDDVLVDRLNTLFRAREPFYAMADITVNTGDTSVGRAVDEIVRKLSPFLS